MPDRDLIGHRQRFRSKVYEKGAELFSVCILHPIAFDGDGCGNYIQDDLQPIYRSDQPAAGIDRN